MITQEEYNLYVVVDMCWRFTLTQYGFNIILVALGKTKAGPARAGIS